MIYYRAEAIGIDLKRPDIELKQIFVWGYQSVEPLTEKQIKQIIKKDFNALADFRYFKFSGFIEISAEEFAADKEGAIYFNTF